MRLITGGSGGYAIYCTKVAQNAAYNMLRLDDTMTAYRNMVFRCSFGDEKTEHIGRKGDTM